MTEPDRFDDAKPSERCPAGTLYVPVRPGSDGCAARLFRTPVGVRTAVGFTSRRQLAATLGHDQPWIRLGAPALRALTEPLGARTVTVDPKLAVDAEPGAAAPDRTAADAAAGTAPRETAQAA
jgi:hypothetical protein